MHFITLKESLNRGLLSLPAGDYLTDDTNAGEFLALDSANVTVSRLDPDYRRFDPIAVGLHIGAPRRLLIVRPGGFGDLLFLTPVLSALRARCPLIEIGVASFPEYRGVLDHNPDVAETVDYPVPRRVADRFDAWLSLEGVIERATEIHAVDALAVAVGLNPSDLPDKRCRYTITDAEARGAIEMFWRDSNHPRLGVQVHASALCRNYPPDLLNAALGMLFNRGWEIFFFGAPGSLAFPDVDRVEANKKPKGDGVIRGQMVNLTQRKLTFRQSAAVLGTCDVVLAPDSALTHLAGAIGTPCVALYGPFPWQNRTSNAPTTFAIQGHAPCAPCNHHVRGGDAWPANGPCATTGRCEALAGIAPVRVAAKCDALLRASRHIKAKAAIADGEPVTTP